MKMLIKYQHSFENWVVACSIWLLPLRWSVLRSCSERISKLKYLNNLSVLHKLEYSSDEEGFVCHFVQKCCAVFFSSFLHCHLQLRLLKWKLNRWFLMNAYLKWKSHTWMAHRTENRLLCFNDIYFNKLKWIEIACVLCCVLWISIYIVEMAVFPLYQPFYETGWDAAAHYISL